MYEMLYLKKRPGAFGHGVSATWNEELTTIYSSFVPTFEVNPVDKECSHIFKDVWQKLSTANIWLCR